MLDPTVASTIGAVAALFAAAGTLLGAVQNMIAYRQVRRESLRNRQVSESNNEAIGHVANQVTAVDGKVDVVTEQTNGHMTSLIAAVVPLDPALATAAAEKKVLREQLAEAREEIRQLRHPPASTG